MSMQSVPKRGRGVGGQLRAILKSLYSKLPIQIYTGTHKSVIPGIYQHIPLAVAFWISLPSIHSFLFWMQAGRHIYSSSSLMYEPKCMCIIKRGAEGAFSRRQSKWDKARLRRRRIFPAADIIDGSLTDDRNVLAGSEKGIRVVRLPLPK